jgi:large subunit ribosomal protein L19e
MSSSLKLQKRLSASILKCGKGKVWMDPNEINEIAMANSRKNVRKLIKDGFILRKPPIMHSRDRARKTAERKAKGRSSGPGKRRGTRNARTPSKLVWIRRIRVLRRLLVKYRAQKKIDRHMYHDLYLKAKGNVFKSKRFLQEYIFKTKSEKLRLKSIETQLTATRQRNKASRKQLGKSVVASLRSAADDSKTKVTKKSVVAAKAATATATATKTAPAKTLPAGKTAKKTTAEKKPATKATEPATTTKTTTTKAKEGVAKTAPTKTATKTTAEKKPATKATTKTTTTKAPTKTAAKKTGAK